MYTSDLSIAVCTYERYDLVHKAISSVVDQVLKQYSYQIIVIDNSPSEERSAKESARYADSKVEWIYEPVAGLSNARNRAARLARSPILAFIDDDAVARSGWALAIIEAFRYFDESVACVGGRVDPVWPSVKPDWLSPGNLAALSIVNLGDQNREIGSTEWVVGANIAYRTEILKQLGGFNTSLGRVGEGLSLMSNDETELSDRLSARGYRTGYVAEAIVDHLVDPARLTQRWFRRRAAWQAVSEFIRNPGSSMTGASENWRNLRSFLLSQDVADRNLRALLLRQGTDKELDWQLASIFDAIIVLLSGLEEAEDV